MRQKRWRSKPNKNTSTIEETEQDNDQASLIESSTKAMPLSQADCDFDL